MTDEYKTDKKERMFGKMGSRPNEIISWHMTEVIKEKHEKSVQVTRSPNTHLNPGSSEYEPEVLTTKPRSSTLYTPKRSTSQTKGHVHRIVRYDIISVFNVHGSVHRNNILVYNSN